MWVSLTGLEGATEVQSNLQRSSAPSSNSRTMTATAVGNVHAISCYVCLMYVNLFNINV